MMKVYEMLEQMINDLCKEWNRELFDSICDLAYENNITVSFDYEQTVCLEDEQFTLSYNMSEC